MITAAEGAPRIWREDFKIHSYEIGPSGFAIPQAICRFIQEAASNHADKLDVSAQEMARRNQLWVLSNLSLRMQTYPRWHESMSIETWPVTKQSSIRAYRDLTLLDGADQVIGRASTMWLLLNKENRRPLKIPTWLKAFTSPGHEVEILCAVNEKHFDGTATNSQEFVIRASDIDWNMHVNNVCYLEWALEAIPAMFRLHNKISALDISFVAEGRYGNSVIAECFEPQENTLPYLHRIVEKSYGKVLAMLRIVWQPKDNVQSLPP
jgi:acyl-ACP thioesterase